ncbi:unnamed protein product [Kluyveromyces dobzhanskii CBS 2104]|uniref:WGS project CCBQ000000000 data, contig 00107 n=1 Tax=Kluyveromyces dobzhanskii CBS 2104 TaxID=1427455 RepID=A0A0A8L0N8_9SACH|nr:unnamed protein product [Kluyveromyces dobzhanskii CBS 2104]
MGGEFKYCPFENTGLKSGVVNDPVSALKQLLENSIDANCTRVQVKVDALSGGCKYIQVDDNGCGISGEKRMFVFLQKFKTLTSCKRIGYNGTALCTIGRAASKKGSIEVITRTDSESTAVRWFPLRIKENEAVKFSRIARRVGTTIILRDIMVQTKKHRSTNGSKAFIKMINEICFHLSLNHQHIYFSCQLVNIQRTGGVRAVRYAGVFDRYEDRASHFRKHLDKKELGYKLKCFEDVVLNCFLNVNLIVPNIMTCAHLPKQPLDYKYLSVNGKGIPLQSSIGRKVNDFFKELYNQFGKPEPEVWFVQFFCHHTVDNISLQDKEKTSTKTIEHALPVLRRLLVGVYSAEISSNAESPPNHLVSGSDSLHHADTKRSLVSQTVAKGSEDQFPEKESEWLRDMCSQPLSGSRSSTSLISCLSSDEADSETCYFDDPNAEDVELSKNVTLSNPFILHRIRARNGTVKGTNQILNVTSNKRDIAFDNVGTVTGNMQNLAVPLTKKAKLHDDTEYDDSITLVELEETTNNFFAARHYSQSQNTFSVNVEISFSFKNPWELLMLKKSYKKELVWFHRKGMPSLPLLDGIQMLMEQEDSDVDLQLTLMPPGWYRIGI